MSYTADEQAAARVIASLIYPDYPNGPDLETHVNGLYGAAVDWCREPYAMAAETMPKDGILRDCHGDAATAWEGLRQMSGTATPYAKLDPLIRTIGGAISPPVHIAGEPAAPPAPALDAPRYELHTLRQLRELPPITWLINGEIPAGLTTIVCGPSGAGKSFLMIDYAMQIARANPDRIVVYIAPEGGNGYHMRADAWLDHFGGDEPENVVFILQAITMLQPKAVDELITTIRPFNPVMIVFDTLARCLIGGDENSAKDVGIFFHHTDLIRQATGSAITIVHHTGKAGNFRGSSALYGSVESWIDVANDDGLITVSCGKSKDAKPFPPRYLRMVEVLDSVVLMPSDQVDQRDAPLSEGKRAILETLSLGIFRDVGAKRTEIVSATGINDRTIFKILSRMKQDGMINQSKKGDPYFISDQGLDTIKSYHRALRESRGNDQVAMPQNTPVRENSKAVTQVANATPVPNAQVAKSQTSSNSKIATSPKQVASSSNNSTLLESATCDATSGRELSERYDDLFPEESDAPEVVNFDDLPVNDITGKVRKATPHDIVIAHADHGEWSGDWVVAVRHTGKLLASAPTHAKAVTLAQQYKDQFNAA